jgi:hypothetical protein
MTIRKVILISLNYPFKMSYIDKMQYDNCKKLLSKGFNYDDDYIQSLRQLKQKSIIDKLRSQNKIR